MSRRTTRSQLPIAVIGAGLGGIACAVNLTRAGLTSEAAFEKSGGPAVPHGTACALESASTRSGGTNRRSRPSRAASVKSD